MNPQVDPQLIFLCFKKEKNSKHYCTYLFRKVRDLLKNALMPAVNRSHKFEFLQNPKDSRQFLFHR